MSDLPLSDPMSPSDEHGLPAWVRRALRAPVAADPAGKARLMMRVRAAGRPPRGAARGARWGARRGLAPLAGLATAAAFAGAMVLGATRASLPTSDAAAIGLRDTLQAGARLAEPLGDSIGGALLRDTLRLVRFVLVAPSATRLALVGDFNGWDPTRTPMLAAAESTGVWAVTVALGPGAHRYAYVADDTQWIADPAMPRAADTTDGARSTVTVPEAHE